MTLVKRIAIVGLLLAGCWAIYGHAPRLAQGTVLAEFSYLVPAVAIFVFLCLAHWLARRAGLED